MSQKSKWEYLKAVYSRYHKVSKALRRLILNEFCQVCGYNRKYAIRLLNGPAPQQPKPHQRKRKTTYGHQVISLLQAIWEAAGYPCSTRLKALLPLWLPWAKKRFHPSANVEGQILCISPATIDRRLKAKRRLLKKRLYGRTKPGTLLKHHIPIKTDCWDVSTPGFTEVDLVSHSGNSAQGDLVLYTARSEIRQHKPSVYQEVGGVKKVISARYVLKGKDQVGFEVGIYDASRALIIDPVVSYSTYLGGADTDEGLSIAVEPSGNAYVAGFTCSTDFPTTRGAFDTVKGGLCDAFVAKLNPAGSGLIYSTYLGGSGDDSGSSIAVDGSGDLYVTGGTDSSNFPTVKPLQAKFGGGVADAFVAKISSIPSGTPVADGGLDGCIEGVSASPSVLWPPNHKMVPVTVVVSVAESCGGIACQIVSVISNEPVNGLADGNTAPDWQITGLLTVQLRAERSGRGSGRVYTIIVICTDASGNSSMQTVTVNVPHTLPK